MVICPVRGCREPLRRDAGRWVCSRGHSFDIARSGYVNLLQPQDRRSKNPGDSGEIVAARRRLHERGVTQPILEALAGSVHASSADQVLDVGCGEGFYLDGLARRFGCGGSGVDLSVPAIDLAARTYPEREWIVANADRFLPFGDGSFSRILSITARVHASEFHRVLDPDGLLVVAAPDEKDLIELRGRGRDHSDYAVENLSPAFQLVDQTAAIAQQKVGEQSMRDLLISIYRPLSALPAGIEVVTLSLKILIFRRA